MSFFFGEDQGRYIIEIDPKNLTNVKKILKYNSVHFDEIGTIIKNEIIFDNEPILSVDDLIEYNTRWLKDYMLQ